MPSSNHKQDGVTYLGAKGEGRESSSIPAAKESRLPPELLEDVEPSAFSHLALRIRRDWQRFGKFTSDMPYIGKPLDNEGYIRLLSLHPGEVEDPVVCELSTEHIEDLPPFEALSYTWGNPEARTPITIAGQPFKATVNLVLALQNLRYRDRPRLLWVDALCINQRDIQEINVQIHHMTNIYSKATGVLAWLGPGDDVASCAFDVVRNLSDTINQDQVSHLMTLFQRPYWTRLWIVQELVLARDIQFVCGKEYLPWVAADRLFRRTPSGSEMPFALFPPHLRNMVYRLRHIWHAREIRYAGGHLTFLQLLNKYNPCRCSEPKDYIYSLLGLAPSHASIHQLVKPDYTNKVSVEDVYRNATAATILEEQNLNALGLVRRYSDHNLEDIPPPMQSKSSWVPDWSCVRIVRPLVEPDDAEQLYTAYKPGRFSRAETFTLIDAGILILKGAVFDTLEIVKGESNPLKEDWKDDLMAWEPDNIKQYRYPSGEDTVDAFWRTLILDDAFAPFHRMHKRLTPQQIPEYRELYLQWRYGSDTPVREEKDGAHEERSFAKCIRWAPDRTTLTGWTFAVTRNGYFARVQPDAESGDVLVLLKGSAIPVLLRRITPGDENSYEDRTQSDDAWKFIGTSYVHGIMDGEAMHNGMLSKEKVFYIV